MKKPFDRSRVLPFVLSLVCAWAPRCVGEQPPGHVPARSKTESGESAAGGQSGRAKTTLDTKQRAKLWEKVGGEDLLAADAAARKLIADGDAAAAFLAREFAKVAPDGKRIAKLIVELDAREYRTRDAASASLQKIGLPAGPFLREALEASQSREVRDRIRAILDAFARGHTDHSQARRYGWAVRILTTVGTIDAFRAAKALVAIAPTHDMRGQARAAVDEIGAGIVRSLMAGAEEKVKTGEPVTAIKLCRQALPTAVGVNHYREKNIRTIIGKLVAGVRVPAKLWQDPQFVVVDLGPGVTMRLTLIRPGKFLMGSGVSAKRLAREYRWPDPDYFAKELPQHQVTITKPFYMSVTQVTQAQYKAVMATKPWKDRKYRKEGGENAASYITWHEAMAFCKKLSTMAQRRVGLPTEAQWEYACRAGGKTRYCFGDDDSKLIEYAWCWKNAENVGEKYAHPVGRKKPNAWRLYDMHGNVLEWCADYYDEKYYSAPGNSVDPTGPVSGSLRVLRGGTFDGYDWQCRSASRAGIRPENRFHSNGFRLVSPVVGCGEPDQ